MDEATRREVENRIDYVFEDESLLERALCHASIASSRQQSNERLEFLGDAVLGLVVCDALYREHPEALEGELTKIKSAVVSRRTCARLAEKLDVVEFLDIGKGMQTHAKMPASLAAAVMESLIGAIFLDGGFNAARDFIVPLFVPVAEKAARSGHQQNFKSVLQQQLQESVGVAPTYVLLDEQGPDHAKCFEVCVQVGAARHESSWGASKKQAEQQAALNALREMGLVEESDGEIVIVGQGSPASGVSLGDDSLD
jgi:ribonuclease-3